jgi:hypothetical protein
VTQTFVVMLAELERALEAAWNQRDDRERAQRLADEALLSFLRSLTMAIPSAPQRSRLAVALDRYEELLRS